MYIVCVYIQYTVYYIYTHYVHTHTSIYTIHIIHMIQTFTWMQSAAKDDYTNHAQFRWKKTSKAHYFESSLDNSGCKKFDI